MSTSADSLLFILLVLCLSLVTSFHPRCMFTRGSRLLQQQSLCMSSTDTSTSNNLDTFATTSSPVVTPATSGSSISPGEVIDHSDEVVLDLDALSAESAFQAFKPKSDLSSMFVSNTDRKAPRQADWFPMLLSPKSLDGTFAGDVGFDPIGFAKDKASLYSMREAEIKHSRLAMLAAAGWPLSELWHKEIASVLGLDSILASADKAPSVLNGGLANGWIIAAGGFSLVVGALLEFKTMSAVSLTFLFTNSLK